MDNFEEEVDEVLEHVVFESRSPKVGIFWVTGSGTIISHVEEVREVIPMSGFKDTDITHYEYWDKLGFPGDYTSIPRGRVIYDVNKDKYLVFAPAEIRNDRKILTKIFREFSLPMKKVAVVDDPHYETMSDPFGSLEDADLEFEF